MSILEIDHLTHGFGDRVLLKEVSFRLLKGEHVGLVGANGVGKTTFLNILTGRLLPDEGSIRWSNRVRTAYLDQHSSLREGNTIRSALRAAFSPLYELEKRILEIAEKMEAAKEMELPALLKEMGNLQEELEQSRFYRIDSLVEEVAAGLGLLALGMDTPVEDLSGGQRTRILLGKLLLEAPDILLLDEPTNHLDREHVEWLAGYLKNYENSFIVISHDTGFLNRIVNVVCLIEAACLKRYPGNYEQFLKLSRQETEAYREQYQRQQEDIRRLETFVRKNIARASTSGLAKSRQKRLDRIQRLEKPGTVSKPAFSFSMARESTRQVFECIEMEIGYDVSLLRPLDLKLERGGKIALTGCNGIGKTTLLKTILGILPPLGGVMEYGDFLFPLYFEQEIKNSSTWTALEEVWHAFPRMSGREVRQALARCGLGQEHVNRSMSALSGGEQARVRLCRLMLTPGNWLLLDEPTNHLDREAKEVLQECLRKYTGTILMACHEKEFYEGWVTGVWDMEQYIPGNLPNKKRYGRIEKYGRQVGVK